MKVYNSFLIRCWLKREPVQPDNSVFEVEHIQTGARKRAASFAELQELMLAALTLENEAAEPRDAPDTNP